MDYKDENTWLMLGDCLERMKEISDNCPYEKMLREKGE